MSDQSQPTTYYIWTLWANDRGRWQMQPTPYTSEEQAKIEGLLFQMGGHMVKVLPEGQKP